MESSPAGQQVGDSDAGLKCFLTNCLQADGFTSLALDVPLGSRIVDVLAIRQGCTYGFEAKSSADSLPRGLHQCRDYAKQLNYVVLTTTQRLPVQLVKAAELSGIGLWRIFLPRCVKEIVQPRFRGQLLLDSIES